MNAAYDHTTPMLVRRQAFVQGTGTDLERGVPVRRSFLRVPSAETEQCSVTLSIPRNVILVFLK